MPEALLRLLERLRRAGETVRDRSAAASVAAILFTWSVAAPSETFGARLNEIVTDAICPECAMLSGPVVCSNVATSVSGTARLVPGT